MFTRYRTVLKLLAVPVPAGFFPIMTCGAIWEVVRPRRGAAPTSLGATAITIGVLVLLSALAIWAFRRMLRRSRSEENVTPYGVGGAAWRTMLWAGFVAGVVCGGALIASTAR